MTFTLRTACYYTARRDNSVHVHHLSTIGADISAPMTMPREEPDVLRTAISSSTEHCTGPTCRAYARRQQATGSFDHPSSRAETRLPPLGSTGSTGRTSRLGRASTRRSSDERPVSQITERKKKNGCSTVYWLYGCSR